MAPLSVEVHIQYIPNVRQKYKCTVLSTQTKLWWTDSVAKRVIYSNKKCMDMESQLRSKAKLHQLYIDSLSITASPKVLLCPNKGSSPYPLKAKEYN